MKLILNYLIYAVALLLRWSYRFEYPEIDRLLKLRFQKRNFLLAIWHQNLLPGILAQKTEPFVVIVSRSADAEPVAFTCRRLGHYVTRGSSRRKGVDKGGQAAKEEMIEWLKKGFPGAVTVDGPKGPAKKVKAGIVQMAIAADCVLVPYTVKAKHYKEFQSWDRFQLPKLFSKIIVHYGEPVDPQQFASEEALVKALEEQMLLEDERISDLVKRA